MSLAEARRWSHAADSRLSGRAESLRETGGNGRSAGVIRARRASFEGPDEFNSGVSTMRIEAVFFSMLNPLMRALLRSPVHGVASRNIAMLHYHGRKSGRQFVIPLSYTREDNLVRLLSSHNTRWWLNFRGEPTSVSVEIATEPGCAECAECHPDL